MPYKPFEYCSLPDSNTEIWRYMSLKKFKKMIKNQALFFCRSDKFVDPFEGSIPRREAEHRPKSFGNESTIKSLGNFHQKLKKHYIVNCWHINNHENDLMWRLYLKNNKGIAIKTTVKNLLNSISDTEEEINCSEVKYLDYNKDIWAPPIDSYNLFSPIIHKRIEFIKEKELRLVHCVDTTISDIEKHWKEIEDIEEGKNLKVNLSKLISEVYIAPTSDANQIQKIQKIVEKYGFDFPVVKSTLSDKPYY